MSRAAPRRLLLLLLLVCGAAAQFGFPEFEDVSVTFVLDESTTENPGTPNGLGRIIGQVQATGVYPMMIMKKEEEERKKKMTMMMMKMMMMMMMMMMIDD